MNLLYWGPIVVLTVKSSSFVSFSASKSISELDCEENKLEVRLFDDCSVLFFFVFFNINLYWVIL